MTDNPPAGIHPLRERLAAEGFVWAPDALIISPDAIVAVVAAWLREEAEMRDSSWLPTDHYAMEDHRPIVARALLVLADAIYPKEAHDGVVGD